MSDKGNDALIAARNRRVKKILEGAENRLSRIAQLSNNSLNDVIRCQADNEHPTKFNISPSNDYEELEVQSILSEASKKKESYPDSTLSPGDSVLSNEPPFIKSRLLLPIIAIITCVLFNLGFSHLLYDNVLIPWIIVEIIHLGLPEWRNQATGVTRWISTIILVRTLVVDFIIYLFIVIFVHGCINSGNIMQL